MGRGRWRWETTWTNDTQLTVAGAMKFLEAYVVTLDDYEKGSNSVKITHAEHQEMNTEGPNPTWTGHLEENPLLDSPPPGFEVIRLGQDTLTIHHRRTGMGCMNAFLVIWLTGWTVGCVMLLVQYLRGGKMEDGTPITLWFLGVFWLAEVVVAFIFAKVVFERRSFQFEGDTLTIERNLLGNIKRRVVSKASVTSVTQVKDGGTGQDSFPGWGLKVKAEKSHGLIFRQPHEQSAWLGQLVADWAEKKFDAVPK